MTTLAWFDTALFTRIVLTFGHFLWQGAAISLIVGFIFSGQGIDNGPILSFTADLLIALSIVLGIASALILGRSYDFLPALRHVKTGYAYQIVRHPMYLSSIIIKVGYVMKNLSVYNVCILILVTVLYDKRAKYEEDIMSQIASYVGYLQQVKYRFMPGIR